MFTRCIFVPALVAMVLGAAPAAAQTSDRSGPLVSPSSDAEAQGASRPASSPPDKIGVRAFAAVDLDSLTASKTFGAVLGTSKLTAFGGGADILNIWRHAFVRVAVTHSSKVGNRGFVNNNQFFSLGIPTTIAMTPIEVGGGWQLSPMGPTAHALTPYVGIAFIRLGYSDISSGPGADPTTDVSTSFTGVGVFGGAQFLVWNPMVVNVEAQFRSLPNTIGAGGISQQFNENDLGGFTLRIMFGAKF